MVETKVQSQVKEGYWFNGLTLRKFDEVRREGKQSLYFVDFIDIDDNFEASGQMLFFGENQMEVAKLEGKKVRAKIGFGQYQGKTSVNVSEIIAY